MPEDNVQTRSLRRKQIELCEYPDGQIKVFYQDKELKYRMLYDRVKPEDALTQGQVVTENKFLGDVLEYAKKRAQELPKINRSTTEPRRKHLKYMSG